MNRDPRDVEDLEEEVGADQSGVTEYVHEAADEDDDMYDMDEETNHDDEDEGDYEEDEEDHEDTDDEDEEDGDDDDADEDDETHQFFSAIFGEPSRLRSVLRLMETLNGGRHGYSLSRREASPTPEPDNEKGREILNSGDFGVVETAHSPVSTPSSNVTRKLWMRQLDPRSVNTTSFGEVVYTSIFASCGQDFKLRIYRTAGNKLIREKVVQGISGQWTITDHALSLDNDWIIYSSITPYVHLTRTAADAPDTHVQLDFSPEDDEGNVGVIYDIESRTVLHSLGAHEDDVNSVCFAEPSSSQVIFSGSDDSTVKVWDRRSMRSSGSGPPSGVLVGHTEGVTHVTSKGDNRYLASNGKDQKMLLWDLRMMHSNRDYRKLPRNRGTGFDYRMDDYYGSKSTKRQGDCSVMTFQGHSVLRTLIRCHFSPVQSTGQRYLYTGSADGQVAIYRLDGTLVKTLDVNAAFKKHTRSPRNMTYIARDVSWNPHCPSIISSCRTDRGYASFADIGGGLVQHAFRMDGVESDNSESESEPPLAPPSRRRRVG
ncbi:hypothetical protein BG004_002039 [Podila humilis]|nr:hypothetical protein BG004_002039 [Podila humilis]